MKPSPNSTRGGQYTEKLSATEVNIYMTCQNEKKLHFNRKIIKKKNSAEKYTQVKVKKKKLLLSNVFKY